MLCLDSQKSNIKIENVEEAGTRMPKIVTRGGHSMKKGSWPTYSTNTLSLGQEVALVPPTSVPATAFTNLYGALPFTSPIYVLNLDDSEPEDLDVAMVLWKSSHNRYPYVSTNGIAPG